MIKHLYRLTALLLCLLLLTGCVSSPAQTTASTKPTGDKPILPNITLPASKKELKVHFIDVGQADCALLECNGSFALIDGGCPETAQLVLAFLAQRGVKKLDLVVASHPHSDHIGGLPEIMERVKVDTVWSSAITYYNSYVGEFQRAVTAQKLEVQYPQIGDTFELGGAVLTVLGPVRTDYEDTNDVSLVIRVQYGDVRFLFTGDMEYAAETDLLDSGADVQADVLKVGHHGSYSSSGYRFLREVKAKYAVISCGAANEYGHPHDETLSRLQDAEITIYRTDRMYTITATTDGESISFDWINQYARPWVPKAA